MKLKQKKLTNRGGATDLKAIFSPIERNLQKKWGISSD